jgi:adenylyltransferase/sulfurtransferase
MIFEDITAPELKQKLDAKEDFQLIDVRQPNEYEFARIEGAKLIPLGEFISRMKELDSDREAIVLCKMGGRSAKAIEVLLQYGYTGKLRNLRGGITAWSNEVDPKVPKY